MRNLETVMIRQAEIEDRIDRLDLEIELPPRSIFVPVMTGAMLFTVDLMRIAVAAVDVRAVIPVYASSYTGTESRGHVKVEFPQFNEASDGISGGDIVIIEDIVDTGRTIAKLRDVIANFKPNSVTVVTLLNKPSRRVVDVKIDWVGFDIEDEFVVGYGLDLDGRYRALPDIWTVRTDTTDDGES